MEYLVVLLMFAQSAIMVPEPPPAPPVVTFDRARAIRNYEAIVRGTLRLHDLTPQEQAEVAEVDRLARAERGERPSAVERCRRDNESRQPSPLEQALTDLKCGR